MEEMHISMSRSRCCSVVSWCLQRSPRCLWRPLLLLKAWRGSVCNHIDLMDLPIGCSPAVYMKTVNKLPCNTPILNRCCSNICTKHYNSAGTTSLGFKTMCSCSRDASYKAELRQSLHGMHSSARWRFFKIPNVFTLSGSIIHQLETAPHRMHECGFLPLASCLGMPWQAVHIFFTF